MGLGWVARYHCAIYGELGVRVKVCILGFVGVEVTAADVDGLLTHRTIQADWQESLLTSVAFMLPYLHIPLGDVLLCGPERLPGIFGWPERLLRVLA